MQLDDLIPASLRDDPEQRRRARLLLLAIAIGVATALLVFMSVASFTGLDRAVSTLVAAGLLISAWGVLGVGKSNHAAAHYFIGIVVICLVLTYRDYAGYGVVGFIGVAVAAIHLLGVASGLFWTLISTLMTLGLGAYVFTDVHDPVMAIAVAAMTVIAGVASAVVEAARVRAVAEGPGQLGDSARTRNVVKNLFPGLIDVEGGKVVYAEDGIRDLAGYAPDQVVGRDIWDFVHPEDAPSVQHWLEQAGAERSIELRLRHKEGHWIWVKCHLIADESEHGVPRYTIAGYDVSAERDSRERTLQEQRLEGVGVLAAGVAHDFNNLLTVITGFAELMDESEARRNILNAADDAAVLVQKLMAFGKGGALNSAGADLVKMVGASEPVLASLLGSGARLHISLPARPVWVQLSSSQINQVLLNLVTNAKEAITGRGNVWIDVELTQLDAVESQLEPGEYAQLTVSDDGQGMDAYSVQRAFDPFYTTKSDRAGTGLGLASVYGIVRGNGGHAMLESEPGKGTSVTLYLALQAAHSEPLTHPEPAAFTRGQGRILVVEDDELVADLIARSLVRAGYSVTIKNDVESAWRHLQSNLPDLLVTDIMMPDGRGTDLAERLRASGLAEQLPILFISGYSDQEIGEWKDAAGQVKFLAKPFRARELSDRVGYMLQARSRSV